MKSILRVAALASIFTLLGFCSIGCAPTVNPPTAPQLGAGYNNQADQDMGTILSGARAFYVSIQQQSAAGNARPSARQSRQPFNDFGVSLNAAEIGLSRHITMGQQLPRRQAQAAVLISSEPSRQALAATGGEAMSTAPTGFWANSQVLASGY